METRQESKVWTYRVPSHTQYNTKNISVGLKPVGEKKAVLRVTAKTHEKDRLFAILEKLKQKLESGQLTLNEIGSRSISLQTAKNLLE